MAVYEVVRMPHYRDGKLYAVGETFVLPAPISNEKEWDYLKRLDPEDDSNPELTPEEQMKADIAAKVAAAKAAAVGK